MKYIEVIGGNFVNKGAELMLLSVLNEIQDWSMIPVVNLRMKSRRRCRELNIQRAGYFESHRASLLNAAFKTATSRVPKKLLRTAGIVKDGDITGILDISGFKYSDQQWQGACKLSGDRFARLKQNSNAKVVMMPQAFGPFESKRSALDFEAMVQHVDILYARDDVSFDHAINALGEAVHLKNKVRLAPDFTPVLRVKVNERSQKNVQ